MFLDKLEKEYSIYSNVKVGNSQPKSTATIILSEAIPFHKFFRESDIITSKYSGLYHFIKYSVNEKIIFTPLEDIQKNFGGKYSITHKNINTIKIGKDALIDLTPFTIKVNKLQAIAKKKAQLNKFLTQLIRDLQKKKFDHFQIIVIPDPESTQTYTRRIPFLIDDIIARKNVDLFFLAIDKSIMKGSRISSLVTSKNTKLKTLWGKFTHYRIEELDERIIVDDISGYVKDLPKKDQEIITKLYSEEVITELDLKEYKPDQLVLKAAVEILSDTNTNKDFKTYNEDIYNKNLKSRIKIGKKILNETVKPVQRGVDKSHEQLKENLPTVNKVQDFKDQYEEKILEKDIEKVLDSFTTDLHYPMVVKKVQVKDASNEMTSKKTVRISFLDPEGQSRSFSVDIPKPLDDNRTYLVNDTKYVLTNQLLTKPIVKISENEVAITTNLSKLFLYRFGENNVNNKTKKMKTKMTNKVKDRDLKPYEFFDAESGYILDKIRSCKFGSIRYFHHSIIDSVFKDLAKEYGFQLKRITKFSELKTLKPIGVNENEKVFLFIDKKGMVHEIDGNDLDKVETNSFTTNKTFINYVKLEIGYKEIFSKTFSRLNIIGQKLPLVLVLMTKYSLKDILNVAKIPFTIVKNNSGIKQTQTRRVFTFNKLSLVCQVKTYDQELLINYLTQLEKKSIFKKYSLESVLRPSTANEFLVEHLSNRIIVGLRKYLNSLIDPITREILEKDLLPTETLELLLYGNYLLSNNKKVRANSFENYRIRNQETIPAMLYKTIFTEHAKFAENYKNSRYKKDLKFSVKKDAIMKDFVSSLPNVQTYSEGNPFLQMEEGQKVSYSGFLGLNNNDAISYDMRKIDPTQRGIIDIQAGVDNANIGNIKYLTLGARIKDVRGTLEILSDEEVKKIADENPGLLFSMTQNIDLMLRMDPSRVLLGSAQSRHLFPSKSQTSKPLLRSGAEEAIANTLSDSFLLKAKEDCEVVKLDRKNSLIYLKNKSGKVTKLSYKEVILRNGGAGFFVRNNYELDKNIKVGKKLKKGDKIAYNDGAFKDGVLSLQGKLSLVTFIPDNTTIEDAGYVSESYAKSLGFSYTKEQHVDIHQNKELLDFKFIGEKVHAKSPICKFQEKLDAKDQVNKSKQNLLPDIFEDSEGFPIDSSYTGEIVDIKVVYNKPESELTDKEKELINKLNALDKKEGKTGFQRRVKKDESGFILGRRINNVLTIFYKVEKKIQGKVGSKLTLLANKEVFYIRPDAEMPVTSDGRIIDVVISSFSLITRMTTIGIMQNLYINEIILQTKDKLMSLIKSGKHKEARSIWVDTIKHVLINENQKYLNKYIKTYTSMTNAQFKDFVENDIHLIVRPTKDPKPSDLKDFIKSNGIIVEDRVQYFDKKTNSFIVSKEPVATGRVMIKHLVQSADKNSTSSHSVDKVNADTGILMNNEKIAQVSLPQLINIYSYGLGKEVIKEFNTLRGDSIESRIAMDNTIMETGEFSLKDASTEGTGGLVKLIEIYMKGAGYKTTLSGQASVSYGKQKVDVR